MSFNKLRNTDLPGAGAGLAPDVPELGKCGSGSVVSQCVRRFTKQLSCFCFLFHLFE